MAKAGIVIGSVLVLLNAACFIVTFLFSAFSAAFIVGSSLCAEPYLLVQPTTAAGSLTESAAYCLASDGSQQPLNGIYSNPDFMNFLRNHGSSIFALVALIPGIFGLVLIGLGVRSLRRTRMCAEFPKNSVAETALLEKLAANVTLSPQQRQAVTERLQRIDHAKQSGRLSGREYERLRREILTELSWA